MTSSLSLVDNLLDTLTPSNSFSSLDSSKELVLITGANRGLGLEFTTQLLSHDFSIIACCRTPSKADKLKQLKSKYKNSLIIEKLDVTNDKEIEILTKKYHKKPIDLLISNAGILGQNNLQITPKLTRETILSVFNTNTASALLLADKLYENVKLSKRKQILIVSSVMGSVETMYVGKMLQAIPYRMSKSALNMCAAMLANRSKLNKDGIQVNSVCPGWVKTDMGTEVAPLTPYESINAVIINVIKEYKNLKNGQYYDRNGKEIPY